MHRLAWVGGGAVLLLVAVVVLLAGGRDEPARPAPAAAPVTEEGAAEEGREAFVYANWDLEDAEPAREPAAAPLPDDAEGADLARRYQGVEMAMPVPPPARERR